MTENRHKLREMEALRAFLTTGTTAAAALRLGVSQSSISRALVQLETRVGLELFVRSSGKIEPTPAALKLNEQLDPLFETLARIEGAEWAVADEEPLRIIVPPTLANNFAISRIGEFLKQQPKGKLQLDIQGSDAVISGVLDRRYDIGMTSAMIQRAGVRLVPWLRSSLVCVIPIGHPLAEKEIVTAADFDQVETIEFLRRFRTRVIMERVFARAGVSPRTVAEVATNYAALELVREGLGVALLNPFPIISGDMKDVVVRSIDAPIIYETSFVLPIDLQLPELARKFMQHIRVSTSSSDFWEII